MAEDDPFADLIGRVRAGDAEAAAELVRQFEPEIRRRVRNWLRLHGPELRPVFESMDVCQSVLADFFAAGSTGQYDLDRPERVLALLTTMARNKLRVISRDQHRQRRDVRRTRALDSEAGGRLVEPSASRVAATRELLGELRNRLTDEERCLVDLRAGGSSWNEIATAMGGTPDSRRKQHARALERVARELGLDPQMEP